MTCKTCNGEVIERMQKENEELQAVLDKKVKGYDIERNLLTKFQKLQKENGDLKNRISLIESFLWDLYEESHGVAGYHLNGDIATWDYLGIQDILNTPPDKSLNEIKAEAIMEAIRNCEPNCTEHNDYIDELLFYVDDSLNRKTKGENNE